RRAPLQLGDPGKARPPFHGSQAGALAAPADDGVGLPVADLGALVSGRRALLDASPSDDPAAALSAAAVTLAPLLLDAQVAVQTATELLVGVDELVDPLMAV